VNNLFGPARRPESRLFVLRQMRLVRPPTLSPFFLSKLPTSPKDTCPLVPNPSPYALPSCRTEMLCTPLKATSLGSSQSHPYLGMPSDPKKRTLFSFRKQLRGLIFCCFFLSPAVSAHTLFRDKSLSRTLIFKSPLSSLFVVEF